jgi:hypothetical protein
MATRATYGIVYNADKIRRYDLIERQNDTFYQSLQPRSRIKTEGDKFQIGALKLKNRPLPAE